MKRKVVLLILALTTVLFACDNNSKKKIIGRYYLTTGEGGGNTFSLSYLINDEGTTVGVIEGSIAAYGYNSDYIVLSQYPYGDESVVNYYIVKVKKQYTYFPEKYMLGPLDRASFDKAAKKYRIDHLELKSVEDLQ